jgi:hypothetical protein
MDEVLPRGIVKKLQRRGIRRLPRCLPGDKARSRRRRKLGKRGAARIDELWRPRTTGEIAMNLKPDRLRQALAAALMSGLGNLPAVAQETHQHGAHSPQTSPAFIASTAKPFSALMHDAMAVMDEGMQRAPMNGVPEHDFVTMMIPHHQGAIDMAKALLLHTKDPELKNLALGIITEQQNEIQVMRAWLARHQAQQGQQGDAGGQVPPSK